MKKEKKGILKIITIILLLVIIALLVLVIYKTKELKDKNIKLTEEIKELQNQKEEVITEQQKPQIKNTIVGEYEYILPHTDEPGLEITIDFMEDGIYYMTLASTVREWNYGTYQVNENKVTLNQEYHISNACGSGENKKEILEYTISDKDTIITDKSQQLKRNNKIDEVAHSFKETLFLEASSECFPTNQ